MILFVASGLYLADKNLANATISAKSQKIFNGWAEYLSPEKKYFVVNISNEAPENKKNAQEQETCLPKLSSYATNPTFNKIVVLGNVAENALKQIGIKKYYKLPEPAAGNAFLNKEVQLEAVLEDCRQWLES